MFWCLLTSVRDIGRSDVCLLSNIMERKGTRLARSSAGCKYTRSREVQNKCSQFKFCVAMLIDHLSLFLMPDVCQIISMGIFTKKIPVFPLSVKPGAMVSNV